MTLVDLLPRSRRLFAAGLSVALLASLIPLASASAAGTVAAASGGDQISADETGTSTFTTLTGPVLTENVAAGWGLGTVVLTAPAGFQFNPASVVTLSLNAGCDITFSSLSLAPTATTITATITGPSSTGICVVTFVGIQVQPTDGHLPHTGNILESGTASDLPTGSYGALTEVAGAPATATFTNATIGSTTGGVAFTPQPVLHVVDQFTNDVSGATVTLSKTPGTGNPAASLICTTSSMTTTSLGVADFTGAGCHFNQTGAAYEVRATAGPISADSNAFDVTVGVADHLAFASYPATGTPSALTPQPSVAVLDAGGNVVNTDSSLITLTINQNPTSFTCLGGTSIAASGGVAQFAGCSVTALGDNYHLTATGGSLPAIVGADFSVSGTPTQLAICWGATLPCNTTPPNPVNSGSPFTFVVRVEDTAGNTVASDNATVVSLAFAAGTPTSGGPGALNCSGGITRTVSAGIATFTCSIARVGIGYAIKATSTPNYVAATSSPFNVVIGPAAKLAFVNPPAGAGAGSPFNPDLQVAIEDAGGNVISSGVTATIQLSFGTNPVGASLNCTGGTQATTVNGVATFPGCSISTQASGYTLIAHAVSVTPAINLANVQTDPFAIGATGATLTIAASASVITWGGSVTLTLGFPAGGAGRSLALQVSKDNATWSTVTTVTTDTSGSATFAYRPSDNRYYRASFAGSSDISSGVSPSTRVVVRQISVLRPTGSGHVKRVPVGTVVNFVTTVRPARPELPPAVVTYVVYQLQGSRWVLVVTRDLTINAAGKTTLTLTFSAPGSFYVRSIARPTTANANSPWSPVERYDVR